MRRNRYLVKKEKSEPKFSGKKTMIILSLLCCFVVAGVGIGMTIYNNHLIKKMTRAVSQYDNIIYPGVKINDIDMSLKTLDEAKGILNTTFQQPILNKKITLIDGQTQYTIDYSKFNPNYNIDQITKEAFDYGKNLDLKERYNLINNPSEKKFSLTFSIDPKYSEEFATELDGKIHVDAVNANFTFQNGTFNVTDEKGGRNLKKDELIALIKQNVNADASVNPVIQIPVEDVNPSITSVALRSVNKIIASSSTNFTTSSEERGTNILLGTKAASGIMLMPGESYSFNGIVGDTTPDKGYKEGGVYVNNKVEKGYGGGICQVSSTLYNVISKVGIKPAERFNHSLPVSYLPLGLDATIANPYYDLVFVNPFNYPIYIEGITNNGQLTFNIYSNENATSGQTYELYSEVVETYEPKTINEDDPTLPVGEKVVDTKGSTGYKVNVFRKTIQNGNVINNEFMYQDVYNVVDEVVKVGTKKVP